MQLNVVQVASVVPARVSGLEGPVIAAAVAERVLRKRNLGKQ